MPLRKLEPAEWKEYFDSISRRFKSPLIDLEVLGPLIGDQKEISGVILKGFSHDARKNQVDVFIEDLDHVISKPKEIYVEENFGVPKWIEIIDAESNKQIITFREL